MAQCTLIKCNALWWKVMNSRIRRPLYISLKSWLCCCSLPTVAPEQICAIWILNIIIIIIIIKNWHCCCCCFFLSLKVRVAMRFTAETRGFLKCKISPLLTWRGGRTYACIDNQIFLLMMLRCARFSLARESSFKRQKPHLFKRLRDNWGTVYEIIINISIRFNWSKH